MNRSSLRCHCHPQPPLLLRQDCRVLDEYSPAGEASYALHHLYANHIDEPILTVDPVTRIVQYAHDHLHNTLASRPSGTAIPWNATKL